MEGRVREHWPSLLTLLLSLLTLAFGRGLHTASDEFLGLEARTWALALVIVIAGLGAQMVVNSRVALLRERRLVQVAAALRVASARLEVEATTDMLTGLPNRRAFAERLGVEYRRAIRYRRPLGVIMIDLDHFKDVNDQHGHPFGDLVLTMVAHTLRKNVRESDLVVRYGGEEFVLLLPETASREALIVAEKLRAAVAAVDCTNGKISITVTISLGVAAMPDCGPSDGETLVELADSALYEAKHAGRDRAVVSPLATAVVPPRPADA